MSAVPHLDTEARLLDTRLRQVAHARRSAELELGLLLLQAQREQLPQRLGYTGVPAYADAELGLSRRVTYALMSVARGARQWPVLQDALQSGALTHTKARELVRVAVDDTVDAWVKRATELTSRELEAEVAAAQPGELPAPAGTERLGPCRRTLVFPDVEAVDAEAIEALFAAVQSAALLADREMNRGQALADCCRAQLERLAADEDGPTGDRHLVVLHRDVVSGVVTGEHSEVSDDLAGQVSCDHVRLDLTDGPSRGTASHAVPPKVARAVRLRDGRACTVPGCGNRLYVDLHHLDWVSRGGEHTEHNTTCLCSQHHRLVHAGSMGVERMGDGSLRFSFADRVLVRPPGPLDLPGDGRRRGVEIGTA